MENFLKKEWRSQILIPLCILAILIIATLGLATLCLILIPQDKHHHNPRIIKKENFTGRVVYDDGVYIGGFKDGKKEGFGRAEFENGDIYVGEWRNDTFDGNGTYFFGLKSSYNPGGVFVGEWRDGRRECHGRYESGSSGGNVYFGHIKTSDNSDSDSDSLSMSKIGEWRDSVRQGQGQLTFSDGSVYTGDFKNNAIDGLGVLKYSNGAMYNGSFRNGQRSGQGQFSYANGFLYIGQFQRDKENGRGVLYFTSGNVYNGTFVDGIMHGSGTFIEPDGRNHFGEYAYGTAIGVHTRTWSNGTQEQVHAYKDENSFWFLPLDHVKSYQDPTIKDFKNNNTFL